MVDREHKLAGTAPVLAAVGAMGKEILDADPSLRPAIQARLLAELQEVDWTKGAGWAGIAGKFSARGAFSVGGTKEVAYAVYNVLTDPTNLGTHACARAPSRRRRTRQAISSRSPSSRRSSSRRPRNQ